MNFIINIWKKIVGDKMKETLKIYRLDRNEITKEQFKQIVLVEQSGNEDCYTEEQLKQIWIDSIKNDNFVCVDNDKIVAHISFNPFSMRRNGSIYIINLIVLPDYRRQGIAQQLINTGCEYYLEKGVNLPVSLSVDKDNIPAISLYKKVGFEIGKPICEIDEDDSQYILDASLNVINENICNSIRKR